MARLKTSKSVAPARAKRVTRTSVKKAAATKPKPKLELVPDPAPAVIPAPEPAAPAAKKAKRAAAVPAPNKVIPAAASAPAIVAEPVPSVEPAVAAVTEPLIETLKKGPDMATTTETIANNAAASSDRVQAIFGDVNARAKTAIENSTKFYEEMTEFTKGNVEALVASGRVAAKGAENLGQGAADYSKRSFETASTTLRSFASAKSPTELFQLQSEFARTLFDSAVAESSKLSESLMKLAGEIAQPLSSRLAVAAEKVKVASL